MPAIEFTEEQLSFVRVRCWNFLDDFAEVDALLWSVDDDEFLEFTPEQVELLRLLCREGSDPVLYLDDDDLDGDRGRDARVASEIVTQLDAVTTT